jgi:hypothetical protein
MRFLRPLLGFVILYRNILSHVTCLFPLVIIRHTCNLLLKTFKSFNVKILLRHWCMHTTYFDQHWSSSGDSKIADETSVLPSVSSVPSCMRQCVLWWWVVSPIMWCLLLWKLQWNSWYDHLERIERSCFPKLDFRRDAGVPRKDGWFENTLNFKGAGLKTYPFFMFTKKKDVFRP